MIFSVSNLGPISKADVEIGDLTVVCGKNNNGKTYLTYTLGTFLDTIKKNVHLPLEEAKVDDLLERGEIQLSLVDYVQQYARAVNQTIPRFKEALPRLLAKHPDLFANTLIKVKLDDEELRRMLNCNYPGFKETFKITETASLCLERGAKSSDIRLSILNKSEIMPARSVVNWNVAYWMARMFDTFSAESVFPETFVITCERTGSMLFRQNLVRVKEDESAGKSELGGGKGHGPLSEYQYPVNRELEFVVNLRKVQADKSRIAKDHPEVLSMLALIAGGSYGYDSTTDQVWFQPEGSGVSSLSLPESSSTVRSLAELYFYLAHVACPGQLLMFDEPELNLHPENQRKLARLLVLLVNRGIKVFITTHSDYMLREFNALTRLKMIRQDERISILAKYGISEDCLLSSEGVKIYMLGNGETTPIQFSRLTRSFGVKSFDNTIEDFNSLYREIRYLDVDDEGER